MKSEHSVFQKLLEELKEQLAYVHFTTYGAGEIFLELSQRFM